MLLLLLLLLLLFTHFFAFLQSLPGVTQSLGEMIVNRGEDLSTAAVAAGGGS